MNLLIRSPNWIGDTVLSTPLVRTIKEKFKDINITILAKKYIKELWSNNPNIDEVISFDDNFRGYFELIKNLHSRKFDTVLILPNSFSSALITYMAGIKERIGYNTDVRGMLLTKRIPLNGIRKKHLVYEYMEFSKIFGIEEDTIKLELFVTDEEKNKANEILKSRDGLNDLIIGICPGATYGPAKRWKKDNWIKVAIKLMEKYNAKILIFGSLNENLLLTEINNSLENRGIIFPGNLNLRMLIVLINKCKVFISNDTGPMHIAASLKAPVVAIFGSSSPAWTGPLGDSNRVLHKNIPCSPCFKRSCDKKNPYECLNLIEPKEVLDEVESLLNG